MTGVAIKITNRADLECLRKCVNNGQVNIDAVLMNDIDLSEGPDWIPIGNPDSEYRGHFDGNGHTISGLHIKTSEEKYEKWLGLFGYVAGGVVENLTVEGEIICTPTPDLKPGGKPSYIGGISAGMSEATITNCINKVKCTGTGFVGGICGYADKGEITKCRNEASLTGMDAAGIASKVSTKYRKHYTKLTECTNISNCINKGDITVSRLSSDYQHTGLRLLASTNYRYNSIGGREGFGTNNREKGKVRFGSGDSFLGLVLAENDFNEFPNTVEEHIRAFLDVDSDPEHINDSGETYLHLLCKNMDPNQNMLSRASQQMMTVFDRAKVLKQLILMFAEETHIDFGAKDKSGKEAADWLKSTKKTPTPKNFEYMMELIEEIKKDKERLQPTEDLEESNSQDPWGM